LLQPQRMIITYGTNNTYMSTEEFIEAYEEALDVLEESWPYADLIIAAVPPVGEDKEDAERVQETIDAFNAALLELAEERDLHFLNTSEVLLGEDGYLKSDYVEADGMHLTAEGAEALVKYVRTHSYITEDRRPELQPQPTRIDPPYQPQEDEMEEQEPAVQPTPTPTPTPTPSSSTSSSAASESTSSTTSISEPEQTSEPAQDSSSAQPPQDATPPAGGEDTTPASTPQQSGSEGQEEVK
ncbi:MAG TPA: SGNH/GDSL hydrolase family protein, partial [Candidatus Pygmaiobacter gallistercoris]|nr:SGNH/GDSL hydrolase family protein [Candidatus Pygmaiobacter gallistercoris]